MITAAIKEVTIPSRQIDIQLTGSFKEVSMILMHLRKKFHGRRISEISDAELKEALMLEGTAQYLVRKIKKAVTAL